MILLLCPQMKLISFYFILKFNNNSISLKVVNVYLHIQALVSYLLLVQPPSLVYL